MSRQRKSRKFTYSLLSPGTFLFLLLLIPSPFLQSHLQLALTCCVFPFLFFLSRMRLGDKTWAVRNDQEMKLPRKGREICMEMHFPVSHCLHERGSPPLSRRTADDSQSAGNAGLLRGFIYFRKGEARFARNGSVLVSEGTDTGGERSQPAPYGPPILFIPELQGAPGCLEQ